MTAAGLLVRALADPPLALALDPDGWTALLTMARAELLLGSLAHRLDGLPVPPAVAPILADARAIADLQRRQALWEAEMARRALGPLGVTVVLLKGTAFAAAGLSAGLGRHIGDLDILVPRDRIDEVERALLAAGWEWVKDDPYDQSYYRRWMHELPPLIHATRDRMIDVHHTILPLTARPRPDAAALLAGRVMLAGSSQPVMPGSSRHPPIHDPDAARGAEGWTPEQVQGDEGQERVPTCEGFSILAPSDMIVHAAAHLFADGDLAGGLRNLWDIDRLLREFAEDAGFWQELGERSRRHGLRPAVARALRLATLLYGTPVDTALAGRARVTDRPFIRRLLARDGWGRATQPATRLAFYVRSHWLRMPPAMLARHLWIKWRKGGEGANAG